MTDPINSQVKRTIITIIESADGNEVHGTERLAIEVGTLNKNHVIKCARAIQHEGIIIIVQSHGGRGHKTVYKLNRNQAGTPRKVKA